MKKILIVLTMAAAITAAATVTLTSPVLPSLTGGVGGGSSSEPDTIIVEPNDSLKKGKKDRIEVEDAMPPEVRKRLDEIKAWQDSAYHLNDSVQPANPYEYHPLVRSQINLQARAYGDSIVLRWAPEDYVSWKYLNLYGYNLLKIGGEHGLDTLAYALKPLSKEQMIAKYPATDSIAGMAAELMYGDGRMKYNQTRNIPGSMGAMVELAEEQNMMFGFAVLASEWRRDLATDMAMRWVDTDVKVGKHYQYILQPTVWPEDSSIIFSPGYIEDIENTRYKPLPYNPEITDSIVSWYQVDLEWPQGPYSSFEIERRGPIDKDSQSSTEWKRQNLRPFVPFLKDNLPTKQTQALFGDKVEAPGTYEYRILAHDMFGDLTEPSPVHTVVMGDLDPPLPPHISWINITRPHEDDPSLDVTATVYFHKDSLEGDLTGYLPLYYNKQITGEQWKPLLKEQVAPTDTMMTFDVTGLKSGMMVVAAVDSAGNMGYSMPVLLRVEDMRGPAAPTNFYALPYPDGRIELNWTAPEDPDIDYYQLAYVNDTTHAWLFVNDMGIRDTAYTDTVALDVNQRFIYYKVRAIDYATNEGDWSEILEVERPTILKPTVAHLDTAWVNNNGIHMHWVTGQDQQLSYHYVYRRLVSTKDWQLIAICDADSVKAEGDMIRITDKPPYNREHMYEYAVESFNSSAISSDLSLAYMASWEGPLLVEIPIKLVGDYDRDKRETRIAWEVGNVPDYGPWYFCIYRKGHDDEFFQFLLSAKADERSFTDVLLSEGQQAQYYITILYEDGRESTHSNTVTVKAPKKK